MATVTMRFRSCFKNQPNSVAITHLLDHFHNNHESPFNKQKLIFTHKDFVSLGFADALNVEQLFFGGISNSLDCVKASVLQLLDVTGTDPTLL